MSQGIIRVIIDAERTAIVDASGRLNYRTDLNAQVAKTPRGAYAISSEILRIHTGDEEIRLDGDPEALVAVSEALDNAQPDADPDAQLVEEAYDEAYEAPYQELAPAMPVTPAAPTAAVASAIKEGELAAQAFPQKWLPVAVGAGVVGLCVVVSLLLPAERTAGSVFGERSELGLLSEQTTGSTVASTTADLVVAEQSATEPTDFATKAIEEPESPVLPVLTRHEIGPVSVATSPENIRTEEKGFTRFSGADPDARYLVRVDDAQGVAFADWQASMAAEVARSADLSDFANTGDVVRYLELPGDGSQSRWYVFPLGQTRVSLVCQTRVAPSPEQEATCEEFVVSAVSTDALERS